ncbi:hypothetical protein NBRC116188_11750 [Oceaniserpentilla sp. 4NH20-0058]|uniref:hypothetical protein n=1 Tax=Oceaniserpentilla sp. 4NH20-0058 TaxID=3127660 RepID=UPI00310B77C6
MKMLPAIPTDNYYKFLALLGSWMMFGVFLLFVWIIYLEYEIEERNIAISSYFSAEGSLRDIQNRLNSINTGEFDDNKLDWVPSNWNLDQEKRILEHAKNENSKTVLVNKWAVETSIDSKTKFLDNPKVIILGLLYLIVALVSIVLGFWRWKEDLHDLDVKLKKNNIELLNKSIEKIDYEIKILKKNSRYRFRKTR